ncbi:SAM-dependent methyltransferase [Bradyrhizobium huanghuaihaiense]|uniref:Methyltransferase family protein n=1 Tax=Bradyrhizobium huanghuaihaiense TaxID=990078 RepID=A0A562R976_9BRAD|nr:class I SAM-dependent methyltransferase [Bradyrhizobium huanghuaihaiense]TWI64980.1 methyltransferase family protein [Bradyrhizobium huanghuaihaiense]
MEDEVSSNEPTSDDGPNARMVRYWNSSATAPWVTLQDRLDALLGPAGDAAIREANPKSAEHVLDVGCGCGGSTLEFARLVGKLGHVTGVDISDQMLARARERVVEKGFAQVTLAVADAGSFAFEPAGFDHIYSRLGIMFFGAPVAAFDNLRSALKTSGRMTFLCCRTAAENTYISTAVQAARPLLPNDAVPIPGPDEPGMFSLANPSRVQDILGRAGFRQIELRRHDERMRLGGPGEAIEAANFSLQFGPLTRVLNDLKPAAREALISAVANAYRQIDGPEGIVLQGAFWIVTARP